MKKSLAAAAIALSFLSSAALAQERVGDAALGALSGGLVLGPVGAVAGAVIGYTAGPAIARSWGLRRSEPPPPRRPAKRVTQGTSKQRASAQGAAPVAIGTVTRNSPPPVSAPAQSAAARTAMPPVQPLE
jgi:hypothetical protein